MEQDNFGGPHTVRKLETVADYLNFYTRALSPRFSLSYLDAFAGTGEIPLSKELPLLANLDGGREIATLVEGSARRSLMIDVPFNRYEFSEIGRSKASELSDLKDEFPNIDISITRKDANIAVTEFCESLSANNRAVIFLDPFGNQVNWKTLEVIAATRKVDLWYLFPAWIGVARQISKDGELTPEARRSIDKMFGPCDWESKFIDFIAPKQYALPFEVGSDTELEAKKIASADGVTRFMISRMKTIFKGGVLDHWLPLGKNGAHWYSLLFAWANPSKAASNLASKVAKDIMTRK